jgi:hypothetical protein
VNTITFNFTPTYETGAEYSFYFLLNANENDDYTSGGLLFWFAGSNILIGNGVKSDYAQVRSGDFPEGTFVNGTTTKITLAAIPYYIDGVQEGYYLAVYVNDAEEPLLEKYIVEADAVLGNYTTIVLQDLGKDYSVKLASAAQTATSADSIMNVTIATSSEKTTFDKPRASLVLSHFAVEGETVGDLVVEGDATYNAETGMLTFGSEGTVKVYYTVTNVFGTFKSNELQLTYDDGVEDETTATGCASSGCGSVTGLGIGSILLAATSVMFALKKKKED